MSSTLHLAPTLTLLWSRIGLLALASVAQLIDHHPMHQKVRFLVWHMPGFQLHPY